MRIHFKSSRGKGTFLVVGIVDSEPTIGFTHAVHYHYWNKPNFWWANARFKWFKAVRLFDYRDLEHFRTVVRSTSRINGKAIGYAWNAYQAMPAATNFIKEMERCEL